MTIIDHSLALAQHATHPGLAGVDLRMMQRNHEAKTAPWIGVFQAGGVFEK